MLALLDVAALLLRTIHPTRDGQRWLYPGLAKERVAFEPCWTVLQGRSDCTEFARDLRRNVDVSDGQIDHVGKGL